MKLNKLEISSLAQKILRELRKEEALRINSMKEANNKIITSFINSNPILKKINQTIKKDFIDNFSFESILFKYLSKENKIKTIKYNHYNLLEIEQEIIITNIDKTLNIEKLIEKIKNKYK